VQLVDWIIWHNENQQPFSWLGSDWGARGGITARELALWTTLQREYRARGLLPAEALSRFDAIGMLWDAPVSGAGVLSSADCCAKLVWLVCRSDNHMAAGGAKLVLLFGLPLSPFLSAFTPLHPLKPVQPFPFGNKPLLPSLPRHGKPHAGRRPC
jgi:hypothetical protein